MLNKLTKFIKQNKSIVITFLVTLFAIGFIFNLNKVTPFGDKSLLCVDFFHQYGPMLGGLYNKVTKFENIIYSFNIGLGIPFFRNFFNYLSSPFNILIFVFTKKTLLTSFSLIIGLKSVCAASTMVYYLNKKFKENNLTFIPLGIAYGLSQYFIAYYWNIMWLDGIVLLPLIVLGIESIVNEKKWKLYFVSLAIMLFSNYFIGYMICIFSCLYFFLYLIYKTKFDLKNIKVTLKFVFDRIKVFAFASLMSGAVIAVFLLPMFKSMFTISATGGDIPSTQYYLFSVRDFLESHLTGVKTTVFASDEITSPNISCGILVLILAIMFFINPKIKIKTKIIYSLLIGSLIFAFFNPAADYIMHAFHVPNDLPYRYSFLYSFLLVIISAYSLKNIKEMNFLVITIIYLLSITGLLYLTLDSWAGIETNMLFINMILLTIFFILYVIYHFFNKYKIHVLIGVILFSTINSIIATNYNWNITQEIKNFYESYNEINKNISYLKNYDKEKFYRVESISMLTLNDGDWYDYNGVNTFSSMAYESMAKFQNKLGIPGNGINSYYYQQTTPVYDLLFDIKYILGTSNDYTRYKSINEENNIQEFKYTNGLIYGVKNDLLNTYIEEQNPFTLQNEIMDNSTGINNIFTKSKYLKNEELYNDNNGSIIKFTYKNNYDNMYFFTNSSFIKFFIIGETLYYLDPDYANLTTGCPSLEYTYIDDYSEKRIINILSTSDTIDITVGYSNYYKNEFLVYDFNHALFEKAFEYLENYKFEYTKFKNNDIEGNIRLDENMIVYTSIPYDEGWNVYVDGKKIKTQAFGNSLLVFKCSQGKHNIVLKYSPPMIKEGFIISIASIIILIIRKKVIKLLKV